MFHAVMSRLISFDDTINEQAAVHEGPLKVAGSLAAPALCMLIPGDLDVEDVLDISRRRRARPVHRRRKCSGRLRKKAPRPDQRFRRGLC
jgi:hypothetical protein